jgi:hypothetical protein
MTVPSNDLNISQSGYCVFNAATGAFTGNTFQAGPGISLTNASGVGGNTTISATAFALSYKAITHTDSPYTVQVSDDYISCDSSGGAITINFPNAPTNYRTWIVKDRTGNASSHNITLTTPGASDTFDGGTTYVMNSNYAAVQLLANSSNNYEIY